MLTLKLIYFAFDALIIYISLVVSGWLKFTSGIFQVSPEALPADLFIIFIIMTFLFLLLFRFQYLYRISLIDGGPNHARRVIIAVVAGHVLMVLIFFLIKNRFITERLYLLLSFCLMALLLLLFRLLLLPLLVGLLQRSSIFGKKTLLIGSGGRARQLFEHLRSIKRCYYKIAVVLSTDGDFASELESSDIPLYRGINQFETAVLENDIKEIIVALEPEEPMTLVSVIDRALEIGIPVNAYSDTFAIIAKKTIVDQFHDLPLARFCRKRSWDRSPINRVLNFILSLLLLIVLSPAIMAIALLIKLTSKGPVFYVDTRVGRDEKPFRMIKFRSMKTDQAESVHKHYAKQFINGEIATGSFYKLQNDSRITTIGHFIRRYSLDELPQLFNVLRGNMNLVGPRPSKIYEYEQYDEWHKKRFMTTPGMTGLWQVKARSEVPFKDMIALDIYYAYTTRFWLDFDILMRTAKAIIIGRGAV